eukprot:TRINITY_DN19534_c0_g1_i1.p1 TRINITY_DN19534_c0_g1~~TRINITY_DN19534_c0_g1_i1.p1  ORF type:complete len:464 (-),score=102.93 TRINITY_DN19534_c0_g1_i1:113-1504(-)
MAKDGKATKKKKKEQQEEDVPVAEMTPEQKAEVRKLRNLQRRFPDKSAERIKEALQKTGGHAGQAAAFLSGTLVPVKPATLRPSDPLAPTSPTNVDSAVDVMRARMERKRRAAMLKAQKEGRPWPEKVKKPPSPPPEPEPEEPTPLPTPEESSDGEFDWPWESWDVMGWLRHYWQLFEDTGLILLARLATAYRETTGRLVRNIDARLEMRRQRRQSEAVERALWLLAFDKGLVEKPPPPRWKAKIRGWRGAQVEWEKMGLSGQIYSNQFTPDDLVIVMDELKPQPSYVRQALFGQTGWACVLLVRLVAAVLFMVFFLGLSILCFSLPPDITFDGISGTLVDPSVASLRPLSTAATVGLRALADYPLLTFDELRGVEDIVFDQNLATHSLRIASIARRPDGSVELNAAAGGTVRVEPDGRSFWQREGFAEARLHHAEAWRTASREFDSSAAWLTAGTVRSFAIS